MSLADGVPSVPSNFLRMSQVGRAEDVEELRLDQVLEAVEADVVLAQEVRERLQELAANLADEVRDRVVLEQVAEERQLDAEDLALQQVLHLAEDGVETVDDHRRVCEERDRLGICGEKFAHGIWSTVPSLIVNSKTSPVPFSRFVTFRPTLTIRWFEFAGGLREGSGR